MGQRGVLKLHVGMIRGILEPKNIMMIELLKGWMMLIIGQKNVHNSSFGKMAGEY